MENKDILLEYRKKLSKLNEEEKVLRDLYLKRIATGEIYGPMTSYASIDKPWLKHYKDEYIKAKLPHMTALDYLKEQNKNNLELPAIDSEFGNYTYKELFEIIDKTAASLYKMGVSKGSKVLTLIPILPHETFLFYGVAEAGGAISILPPQTPVSEVCKSINDLETEVIFIFEHFLTEEMEQSIYENTKIKNIVNISFGPSREHDARTISWEEFYGLSDNFTMPNVDRKPDDVLFIAKTGGSTGTPKNVELTDNGFNMIVHQFINSDVNYNTGDKWIRLWLLFSASAAVANHHLPLSLGMNNLLRPFPLDMSVFDKMIYDDKPNHIVVIPQLIDILENSELLKNEDLSFVKTAGCGGMTITSQFEERVNKFYKEHNINTFLGYGWGQTEHTTNIAMRSNSATTKIGTVGAPMVKTTVSVFEPFTLEELPYGFEGELCVNSPTIMKGYYNDEELTNEVIKTHPDGSVWLHTGDSGVIDTDGVITVKGRISRVIFVFPTAKIYPSNIEDIISQVPGVKEVCVCQAPDELHDGFYKPIAFVVPEEGYDHEVVRDAVYDISKSKFPEYSRPKNVFVRDYLPLTSVGKPDARALEQEALDLLVLTRTKN